MLWGVQVKVVQALLVTNVAMADVYKLAQSQPQEMQVTRQQVVPFTWCVVAPWELSMYE